MNSFSVNGFSGVSGVLSSVVLSSGNSTSLTIKSSPPKTAPVAARLAVREKTVSRKLALEEASPWRAPSEMAVVGGSGFMTKRNEQQQYCALVPQTLLYYFDSAESESARGIIDLEYYTEVEIVAKHTIRLATPSDIPLRAFFFRAESEEQCNAWVSALTRERYFVVTDQRDAYRKLQTEFQKHLAATSEAVEVLRDGISAQRASCDAADVRAASALRQLSAQARALGLSGDAAESLGDARDAVREVAHRVHYQMRRALQLRSAIDVARRRTEEVQRAMARGPLQGDDCDDAYAAAADALAASAPSSSSLGSSTRSASATSWEMGAVRVRATSLDSDSDGADDAAARLREVDDLREKLHAARRAREREATSRAGLAADAAALRSDLEDLQQRVARTARARVLAEQRASELSDQKRILVREVRQVRKVVADATAVSLPVADATAVASLPGDPGDHVGASGAAPLDGARAEPPALAESDDDSTRAPPPPSILCQRCGGTSADGAVEGPHDSTCTCDAPKV
ncbi:hypothetical protein M885DRAFT_621614 [Pelagophyceae sp. CCMP2097]|nr:hypothetical protein M885DRAFT_621614 [Pelagophyceae sp. CCMP2097]